MIKISCVSSAMLNKFRIILLILGIILIIAGIALPSYFVENSYRIAFVIAGIILFLCSFLKKRTMYFSIFISENKPFLTITLKKGIINSIEKETFEAAVNTLNRIVLANAIAK
jgi:membrane protein implicated in regulation of membrane protease activity